MPQTPRGDPTIEPILDVDALMVEIAARLPDEDDFSLAPFIDDVSPHMTSGRFAVTPSIHPSTKPVVGPLVTRGKRMASRAAMPMVADLGVQVAAALDSMQLSIDELLADIEHLHSRIRDLEERVKASEGP
jgi:hypothetical protein